MRGLLLALAVAVTVAVIGCSGPARVRSPYVMMARRIPKAVKRIEGARQARASNAGDRALSSEQPLTEVTGNLVR